MDKTTQQRMLAELNAMPREDLLKMLTELNGMRRDDLLSRFETLDVHVRELDRRFALLNGLLKGCMVPIEEQYALLRREMKDCQTLMVDLGNRLEQQAEAMAKP